MLDLMAVVTELQPVGTIQIKSTGEMKDKRNIILADDSGLSISATLWGEEAFRDDIAVGTIVAFKGCRVSDYGGKSLNLPSGPTNIIVNPINELRFKELKNWYKNQGGKEGQITSLT